MPEGSIGLLERALKLKDHHFRSKHQPGNPKNLAYLPYFSEQTILKFLDSDKS